VAIYNGNEQMTISFHDSIIVNSDLP
jgi:hypothetical protein